MGSPPAALPATPLRCAQQNCAATGHPACSHAAAASALAPPPPAAVATGQGSPHRPPGFTSTPRSPTQAGASTLAAHLRTRRGPALAAAALALALLALAAQLLPPVAAARLPGSNSIGTSSGASSEAAAMSASAAQALVRPIKAVVRGQKQMEGAGAEGAAAAA